MFLCFMEDLGVIKFWVDLKDFRKYFEKAKINFNICMKDSATYIS